MHPTLVFRRVQFIAPYNIIHCIYIIMAGLLNVWVWDIIVGWYVVKFGICGVVMVVYRRVQFIAP